MQSTPLYNKHAFIQFFENIYFFSLLLVAISLPLSHIGMSIAQFGFGIAVFGGLHYGTKWKRLKLNNLALMWIGLFLLFLLSGFHSEDQIYFWSDIRTKMPLWVFATAIAVMPRLSMIKFSAVLHAFLLGLMGHILLGLFILLSDPYSVMADYRSLSPLVSHIRMGIFLVMGIWIMAYFLQKRLKKYRFFHPALYIAGIVIFLIWLVILKSLTALFILFALSLVAGFFFALEMKNRKKARILVALCWFPLLSGLVFTGFHVYHFFDREKVVFSEEPQYSAAGCLYENKPGQEFYENGRYVFKDYCTGELVDAWNARSDIDYFANDWAVHYTLLRYMTSRNYSKDALGMLKMTDADIRNVEKGIPNYRYTAFFGLSGRIYETLWELEVWWDSGDAQGKSLATRFELWKAAWKVIRNNHLAGVGAGDLRMELQKAVYASENPIRYDKSYSAHNQFLSTAVALGVPGAIWLITTLLYPIFYGGKNNRLLFFFSLITLLSMLNEDVFETQASITFICFFTHLLYRPENK